MSETLGFASYWRGSVPLPSLLIIATFALGGWFLACTPTGETRGGGGDAGVGRQHALSSAGSPGVACPAYLEVVPPLPGTDPKYLSLSYWLAQLKSRVDLDEVLLTPVQIDTLQAALRLPRENYHGPRDLLEPLNVAELASEVDVRRSWAKEKLLSGEYVGRTGQKLDPSTLGVLDESVPLAASSPALHLALSDAQIHCAPLPESFYGPALDLRLDRNACSVLRAQDPVRVIAEWPNHMKLIQASYSFGWLMPDAALSPPLPEPMKAVLVHGPMLQIAGGSLEVGSGPSRVRVSEGSRLPAADRDGGRVYVATANGLVTSSGADSVRFLHTRRNLTRRAFLEEAFRYVGTRYGLGDTAGGRDCSRLLMDAFLAFGLELPRHSTHQGEAGSFWIDVQSVPEEQRLRLFDAALQKGLVLLGFPGHIMFYLGRNHRGEPMVLHGLGEYVQPCSGHPTAGGETLVRVRDITVSNLELGRNTPRTALLQRITRVTVIGGHPGSELEGVAKLRPTPPARLPADRQCRDSQAAAIYAMPEVPNPKQPLRIVSVMNEDAGPATLTLVDPQGERFVPDVVTLGGPPYGKVATVPNPHPGRWKAVFADGDEVIACQSIVVSAHRPKRPEPDQGPIWKPKRSWDMARENLYASFVERLFDYPLAEDRTWTNLHSILRDAEHNILFDYRSQDEDNALQIRPDCADLPYVLRSYFAWKLRLPFGYRQCTRGRAGKPPSCDEPGARDNLMSRVELPGKSGATQRLGDVAAFSWFLNTQLSPAVHSSSGRTAPADDLTDFYPVALERRALKPGITFADPYGHLLVIAKWIPQGLDGSGMLIGVDAQPDGTVGQRRFWRGSFLFQPDTSGGGAGFKAFRPRRFVPKPLSLDLNIDGAEVTVQRIGYLKELRNEDLKHSPHFPRFSLEQYQGSADDFYAKLESLINPRPLDAKVALRALVQALYEAVTRRVLALDNGEKWLSSHPGTVVNMPEGESIFLSRGPWEDFATPSRDLRLLIAMDTVQRFSATVRSAPAHYGLEPAHLSEELAALDRLLKAELSDRSFSYRRSDGSTQRLSLRDVMDRATAFEVGYDPNDCVELRWGAPPGSAEASTCVRRASAEERAKLERYRHWFATRTRPPQ